MDEPLDMRDEMEQDFGDTEDSEDDELKASGMHVDGEDDAAPIEEDEKY